MLIKFIIPDISTAPQVLKKKNHIKLIANGSDDYLKWINKTLS